MEYMVTYRNTSADAKTFQGVTVAAGAKLSVPRYVYPLDPAFEVTKHLDAPWKTFTLTEAGTVTGLSAYPQILVENDSGATAIIYVNGDTDDVHAVFNGAMWPIPNNLEIDTLTVQSMGSDGSVYLVCPRNAS